MSAVPPALTTRLQYTFRDQSLLVRALTHKSRLADKGVGAVPEDNEQLEFLGDSILGFLVSEELVRRFPQYPEGRLSKLKAWLVSAQHLYSVADRLNLGAELLLGRGEEMSGGRAKKALQANATEAILAAIYLDGGIQAARAFVDQHLFAVHGSLEDSIPGELLDFKSALQERVQALKLPQPRYAIAAEAGPEHAKTFTVEVKIGKTYSAQADGISKKEAGQRAAERMLVLLPLL